MSMIRYDYIIFGWKLDRTIKDRNNDEVQLWDEAFIPYIEGHRKNQPFRIIDDRAFGEYMVFGYLIKQTEEWDFFNLNTNLPNPEEVKQKYRDLFNNEPESEPKLFIFTNFT